MTATGNQATVGSGVGAALGVAVVILVPKLVTEWTWTPEEASVMTGAAGTIFAYLIRFLPRPEP